MEDGWGRSVWWWMEVNKVRGKRRRGDGGEGGVNPSRIISQQWREGGEPPAQQKLIC